jgi:RNA polymerase sigma factor (sigma-70 family)
MNVTQTRDHRADEWTKKRRSTRGYSNEEFEKMTERERFFVGIKEKENDLTDAERWELVGTVNGMMWQAAHKFVYVNRWMLIEDAHHEIMVQVFRRACVHQKDRASFTTNAMNGIMAARTMMLAKRRQTIDARSIDAPMAGDNGYTLADELHTDTGPKGVAWTQAEWDETLCVLDARSRKVVELHLVHDMSFAQVAGVLGLSSERAKQLYRAAKARLQRFECEMGLFDEVA